MNNKRFRILSIILSLVMIVGMAAPVASADGDGWWIHPVASSIDMRVGETYYGYNNVTFSPSTAVLRWDSDNKSVATVDENGYIKALKAGTAYIKADIGIDACATYFRVVVSNKDTGTINIKNASISLEVNSTYNGFNNITYSPAGAAVSWWVDDSRIAAVNSSGTITGVRAGKTYVNVKVGDATDFFEVEVKEPSGQITVKERTISLYVGDSYRGYNNITYSPSSAVVYWESDYPTVASVDSNGNIKANRAGSASIQVYVNGVWDRFTVKVSDYPTTSVSVKKSSIDLEKGDTYKSINNITYSPSSAKLTYESSNWNVATVDSNGVVKAVRTGSAKIYIYNGSASASYTVYVSDNTPYLNIYKDYVSIAIGETYNGYNNISYGPDSTYVDWYVDDSSIASVTSGGKIKGNKAGTTTVYVYTKYSYDYFIVTVSRNGTATYDVVNAKSLSADSSSVSIATGENYNGKNNLTYSPSNATFKWYVDDYTIASVNSSGTIKGIKAGTTKVTAVSGSRSVTYKVTVSGSKSYLSMSKMNISVGEESDKLSVMSLPSDHYVKWSITSGSSYVSFDTDGTYNQHCYVRGKAVGTSEVTAYVVNKSTGKTIQTLTCKVTVKSASTSLPFKDIPQNAIYRDDVEYVYQHKIFMGRSDTIFDPSGDVIRGDLVTVLWRVAGSPSPKGRSPFTDVPSNSYYKDAIVWAAENGITNGTSDTTFSPKTPVTREQFITLLYRYGKNYMGYNVSVSSSVNLNYFYDSSEVSDWSEQAMRWAYSVKVINTEQDGRTLMPQVDAQRYQSAQFLARFCRNYGVKLTSLI